MLQRKVIEHVVAVQKNKIAQAKTYTRIDLGKIEIVDDFALVISGIRRCGKSTLISQLIEKQEENSFFLNFDTPQLFEFEFSDFRLLDEIIAHQPEVKVLFFDEIQVIANWEIYVRGKLDEGYNVVVTGSNASLLSKELGTKLTGRHLTKELFPFSYAEFCGYKSLEQNEESLLSYLKIGGFPQYIITENEEILYALINDILYRDIAVRYNIRNEKPLKSLITFAAANVGNLISANKLKQSIGVKSSATVLEYLSFLENLYVIELVPKFSYSYRVQLVNPKKMYFIDNGLQSAISPSFSQDIGRKLENLVFWELRRFYTEIFYFNENNKECDFVVCQKNKPKILIQVCAHLNAENIDRESLGLLDAMDFFEMKKAYIITLNQRDKIIDGDRTIIVEPLFDIALDEL